MSRSLSGFQTWVKPLSAVPSPGKLKSFFVVLLNTNDAAAVDVPVVFDDWHGAGGWHHPRQAAGVRVGLQLSTTEYE